MCCEIYILEVNAIAGTKDEYRFIIFLRRGLSPSLLPIEPSKEIGILNAFVSFPAVNFKGFE